MRTTFSILAILLACLQVSHAYVIKPVTQTLGTKLTPKGNSHVGRKSRLNYKDQEGEETIQVSRKMGSNEVFFHPVHTQPELHEQPTVKINEKLDSLMDMEMLYGRIAMVSAVVLLVTEHFTDRTLLEQFEFALGVLK
ncbi:hypothetical protein TrRE_jg13270 [Triparma retinervis]|uniref:Uncharacterized protein n=1 Tax=Triparma retinervis TaxID=2557542 RepID=A0A9W7CGT4_9STRA|nr:hypothetical protein TrRE_jg13270 [Triparma retinervis]